MSQTLYVMQGVPGSGKSTIAKMIAQSVWHPSTHCYVFSTDDFHYEYPVVEPIDRNKPPPEPIYVFKPEKLGEFHRKNYERTIKALNEGHSVVIDNTSIKRKDCKGYVFHAHKMGIAIIFIRVTGQFKSIHGVPEEVIERMRGQMQDLTVQNVLES